MIKTVEVYLDFEKYPSRIISIDLGSTYNFIDVNMKLSRDLAMIKLDNSDYISLKMLPLCKPFKKLNISWLPGADYTKLMFYVSDCCIYEERKMTKTIRLPLSRSEVFVYDAESALFYVDRISVVPLETMDYCETFITLARGRDTSELYARSYTQFNINDFVTSVYISTQCQWCIEIVVNEDSNIDIEFHVPW